MTVIVTMLAGAEAAAAAAAAAALESCRCCMLAGFGIYVSRPSKVLISELLLDSVTWVLVLHYTMMTAHRVT